MKNKPMKNNKKRNLRKSPIFLIALFNFLIIILILIYMIYLRFIPYQTITYDGYAVSGKELAGYLLDTSFNAPESINALVVQDQDEIFKNLESYYLGADKTKNINLDYPIYVNDNLALYNLSSDVKLITSDLNKVEGYTGMTLTKGTLYNSDTLERADYNEYILMENSENLFINTQEIKINTTFNKYLIEMNSIINFSHDFITYYTLVDGNFIYNKILDVDMSSIVEIEDFDKEYTYEEFLLKLNIINENKGFEKDEEEEEIEQPKNEYEENTEENVIEEIKNEQNNNDVKEPIVWQKPEVTCSEIKPSVYIATADVTISDPSNTIVKSLVFEFYKDDKLSFRLPMISTGKLKATKLIPNTEYKVIGKYQYINEEGKTIEVKFKEQEFKTKEIDIIKEIDLDIKEGEKFNNKIQFKELGIISDIEDEAIYGVNKATIKLNDVEYAIDSKTLRKLLDGETLENFEWDKGILSNETYNYEVIFYDTANNKMKVINNNGTTYTLKSEPYVNIIVKKQNVVSIELGIELDNRDKIDIYNYRYVLYTDEGEQIKKDSLSVQDTSLILENLDPERVYNIKLYADFDMEDGRGRQEDVKIGDVLFNTVGLERLGSLKLELDYNYEEDLKSDELKFSIKINEKKTDSRLLQILKEIKIDINDENGKNIKSFTEVDFEELRNERSKNIRLQGLNSNSNYNINITAKAKQGSQEKSIITSYTLKKFKTKKQAPEVNVSKVIATDKMIDFNLYIEDIDGASQNKDENGIPLYSIKLRHQRIEESGFWEEIEQIRNVRANTNIEMSYSDLENVGEYKVEIISEEYNETDLHVYSSNNKIIGEQTFELGGITGSLNLIYVKKNKIESGKNLVDITANNNWYSKCFDVISTEYGTDDFHNEEFKINSTRNYGKTSTADSRGSTLTLTGNQCYVYDLREYIGQTITMSFMIEGNTNNIFIQEGKEIKDDRPISLPVPQDGYYTYITKVPDDGYIGFYIKKSETEVNTVTIKNLQIEKGDIRTEYEGYQSNKVTGLLNCNINIEDENLNRAKCYTKINGQQYEIDYTSDNPSQEFNIDSDGQYKIELIAYMYGKEYVICEVDFEYSSQRYSEIKSIDSIDEYKTIQPDGNYFISSNLDLKQEGSESEYTFGNKNIVFNGKIDFNGKTIEKDIVYYNDIEGNNKKNTSYMFYEIGDGAKITNIVLDIYINNDGINMYNINELDGIYGLFLHNQGRIDNIIVNLRKCSREKKRYVGLIGYNNEIGTINKFIINLETELTGEQYISGGVFKSSGTIKNGYMYGENIHLINQINEGTSRNSAGILYQLYRRDENLNGGTLKNIYNTTGIRIEHCEGTNSYAANIVYDVTDGQVENVYSVRGCGVYENHTYKYIDQMNQEYTAGPNVFNRGNVQKSYYFCENQGNSMDEYMEKSKLSDKTVHNMILNEEDAFNIETRVSKGYYPILNLNNCMPMQEKNIIFDNFQLEEAIDLVTATVLDDGYERTISNERYKDNKGYKEVIQGIEETLGMDIREYIRTENQCLAMLKIYNPDGYRINKINIENIQGTEIVYEVYAENDDNRIVFLKIYNPTLYVDNYKILSVEGGDNNYIKDIDIDIELEMPFYKNINTFDDWKNIYIGENGLIQNYILNEDIDFGGEENLQDYYEVALFSGEINGNGKTIRNISSDVPIFNQVSGQISNLTIEDITISSNNTQLGFIGDLIGTVQNITINGMEIELENDDGNEATKYIGALAAIGRNTASNISVNNFTVYINNGENVIIGGIYGDAESNGTFEDVEIGGFVEESNVNNIEVKNSKEEDKITTNNLVVGGICGIGNNNIKNSYVNLLRVHCSDNEDNNADNTIGGILGKANSDLEIERCFVQDIQVTIEHTQLKGIGGIIGFVQNKEVSINYCWTQGTITSNRGNIGGIMGYGYKTNIVGCYSVVDINTKLGDSVTTIPDNEYIGGMIGYNRSTTNIYKNMYLGNILTQYVRQNQIQRIFRTNSIKRDYCKQLCI